MSRYLKILVPGILAGVLLSWGLMRLDAMQWSASGARGSEASGETGRNVPQRIITMSPAVTEMVFALNAGDRVVGVSQFVSYPPEATEKPQCGGFMNPNSERILMLQPDLVITQGRSRSLAEFCRRHDIELLSVAIEDLDSIFDAIRSIGDALGLEAMAAKVCAEMRLQLAEVRLAVEDREPVDAFVVVQREPGTLNRLSTIDASSFLDDLVEIAGGRNVFGDVTRSYGVVNKEAVLQRKPEVIVELRGEGQVTEEQTRKVRRLWSSMESIPAVRSGRIYAIESTYAMIPGPRVVKLARRLAELFHGEEVR